MPNTCHTVAENKTDVSRVPGKVGLQNATLYQASKQE